MNPLQPSASLLCKLGSIATHVQEMFSVQGHEFDRIELETRVADAEVIQWLALMEALALIPRKRVPEDMQLAAKQIVEGKEHRGGVRQPPASKRRPPAPKGQGGKK